MITINIIEGLTILEKYRSKQGGYNCGAEHDNLYVYATDLPVSEVDLIRLIELGWFQEETDYGDDEETEGRFAIKHYDQSLSWCCYV